MAKTEGPKMEKINGFDKWEVESWLRACQEAIEVKKDPKKMKAIQKLAKEQAKELKSTISSLDELRKKANSNDEDY